ncbi:MAG TPA: ATP-binding protein [Burkholderiales bacterium]
MFTSAGAIERLLTTQISLRNNRRLQTAMRSSRLPAIKTVVQCDVAFQPLIRREQVASMHEFGFIKRREKTPLVISLAVAVCFYSPTDPIRVRFELTS